MKVAFRIDMSSSIGMGHFVRMSALAHALEQMGCVCSFFRGEDEPVDFDPFDIVVLDTYQISSQYISRLRCGNRLLVCYDDNALYSYDCDVLLNANIHAGELKFKFSGPEPLVLLGPRYAILRKEFHHAKPIEVKRVAKDVFVCFGGTDMRRFTPVAVKALQAIPNIALNVVLGAQTDCDSAIAELKRPNVRVFRGPPNISEIMASCDGAVIGAGSMVYELACLGVPSIVVVLADNQELVADCLERQGLMKCAGNWDASPRVREETEKLLRNFERRKTESERLVKTVNKQGALLAAEAILGAAHRLLGTT